MFVPPAVELHELAYFSNDAVSSQVWWPGLLPSSSSAVPAVQLSSQQLDRRNPTTDRHSAVHQDRWHHRLRPTRQPTESEFGKHVLDQITKTITQKTKASHFSIIEMLLRIFHFTFELVLVIVWYTQIGSSISSPKNSSKPKEEEKKNTQNIYFQNYVIELYCHVNQDWWGPFLSA